VVACAGESKLFHAIVVTGLAFASGGCGASTGLGVNRDGGDAVGEALPTDAASQPNEAARLSDAGVDAYGGGFLLAPPDAGAPDAAVPFCRPDASSGSGCAWPIYV
jgi:hypothetical protein